MSDRFQLHGALVARVAGQPVENLESLRANGARRHLEALRDLEALISGQRDVVSEMLHGAIADARAEDRALLIGVRRSLYGGRAPKNLPIALSVLPEHVAAATETAAARLRKIDAMTIEYARLFESECRAARDQFTSYLDADFRRALALSSDQLLCALPKYTKALTMRPTAKAQQTERGLLRYYSRMVAKQTPFGTFCTVLSGHSAVAGTSSARLSGELTKRTRLRLNKGLFAILWPLLADVPDIRDTLRIEINPTLVRSEEHYCFLAKISEKEAFQRLPRSDVLREILEWVGRGEGDSYAELVRAVAVMFPDADRMRQVSAYLDRLVALGLLRLRSGVPDQHPDWDYFLTRTLADIEHPAAATARELLRTLRAGMDTMVVAAAEHRILILRELRVEIQRALVALGGKSALPNGFVCYEDATANAELQVEVGSELGEAFDKLGGLLDRLRMVAWPRNEQATMRHFFDTHYDDRETNVPLLTFYEDFFRHHFKRHLELEGLAASAPARQGYDVANPFKLAVLETWSRSVQSIAATIATRFQQCPDAAEIELTAGDFDVALAPVAPPADEVSSVSLFCHLVPPGEDCAGWRIVAPQLRALTGFGKYFSRFLYLFPEDVTARLRHSNLTMTADDLAEISGDASFNANLHPEVLSWQLEYPTGDSDASGSQRLRPTELMVSRTPDDPHSLSLRHAKSGTRVWPVDLGFLNPRMRPALYQLLSKFQPPSVMSIPLPAAMRPRIEEWNSHPNDPDTLPIFFTPRLTYERAIVLARRTWYVPSERVPTPIAAESDAEYFRRVEDWRVQCGLPERFYVRVLPRPVPQVSADPGVHRDALSANQVHRSRPRSRRDDRKPQYIDLANPLLVGILGRIGGNLPLFALAIEEALPDTQHAVEGPDGRYLVECMLQFDRRETYASGQAHSELLDRHVVAHHAD